MRLALAPKVAVVEEDTAVAEEDEVVAEEDKGVAEEDKGVAEEDKGVAEEDQTVAVASNHPQQGREVWYQEFKTRISKVERDYAFTKKA
jgi:hypothetical protein